MKKSKLRNKYGTRLSPSGYVLCGHCSAEVSEISRDTAPQYAVCRKHGTWSVNTMVGKECLVEGKHGLLTD